MRKQNSFEYQNWNKKNPKKIPKIRVQHAKNVDNTYKTVTASWLGENSCGVMVVLTVIEPTVEWSLCSTLRPLPPHMLCSYILHRVCMLCAVNGWCTVQYAIVGARIECSSSMNILQYSHYLKGSVCEYIGVFLLFHYYLKPATQNRLRASILFFFQYAVVQLASVCVYGEGIEEPANRKSTHTSHTHFWIKRQTCGFFFLAFV